MRSNRRRHLLRILHEGRASSQQELIEGLRAAGHEVTQATVSRDLHEIGAVKVRIGDRVAYRLPDDVPQLRPRRDVAAELEEYVVEVRRAGTLVVLLTIPGHASAVARAIDLAGVGGIVGTIAGDDTVFVATPTASVASRITGAFSRMVDGGEEVVDG